MIDVIFVILALVLFARLSKVNKDVSDIRSELNNLKTQGTHQTVVSTVKAEQGYVPQNAPWEAPVNANSPINTASTPAFSAPVAREESEFVKWFKENPLLKVGILMILAGFGWFVSYAFAHNWIGPVGRITLGVLTGTLVTIAGTFRLGKDETQGNALTILGTALIIISVLAGEYFFGFFNAYTVLIIIFFVSLYTSLSAVAFSSQRLAVYGMLTSLSAPFFAHSVDINTLVLYLYLLVISVSAIWISVVKKWQSVSLVGITGILLYSLPRILDDSFALNFEKYFILLVAYSISSLYLGVGIWSLVRNKIKAEAGDLHLALVNTVLILGFTISIVPTFLQSLVVAGWMIVYALSGFFVFEKTKNEKLFYIHALISILLLAVATSIELSGQTLVIAFAIEAAIVCVASFVVTNKIKISESFAMLLSVPVVMSFASFASNKWNYGVFHSDFAVLIVMAVVLGVLGIFYKKNSSPSTELSMYHVVIVGSTVYIYGIIWLVLHSVLAGDSAVFLSLFIYTVIGLGCHFYGLFNQNKALRQYGMAMLVLVVTRLVLVDVWKMELILRVVTFIVLGVMFMSSAFISKKQGQ